MIENFWRGVKNHFALAKLIVVIIIIGLLLWLVHQSPYVFHPSSVEDVRIWVYSYGSLGPLVYIGLYTVRPLLFFPSILLNLSAGILFGPVLGILYLLIGGLGSAILCYFLGRMGGGRYLIARYGGTWGECLTKYLHGEQTFIKMLWLRLVPIFPYDPVSIVAGFCNMNIKTYILATLVGMLPGAVAYNLLGESLLGGGNLYLTIIVICTAFLLPLACWSLRGEHKNLRG